MPFSSILIPLASLEGKSADWSSTDTSHLMLPVRENGSNVYKFNHATRLLLTRSDLEPTMDHFPGAKDLYNAYATGAPRNALMAPAEYSNTIKHTFKLGKFLMEGAVYGRFFDQPNRNLGYNVERYASRNVFQAVNWSDMPTQIGDLNRLYEAKQALQSIAANAIAALVVNRANNNNEAAIIAEQA